MGVLFTVGYERRSISGFIDILRQQGVKMVIDVRQYPNSRRKGFSKSALTKALAEAGIIYESVSALGSPPDLRKEYRLTGDVGRFFRCFELHLNAQEDALENLLERVQTETCCLLCYERDPNLCHRKVVADRIKTLDANGLRIRHLL
jgi:uncharacterized protein (DUF488 family)